MKKNGHCIWEDHCIMGKTCPGDEVCSFKDTIVEKLAKGELPCILAGPNKKDGFCNLLPVREHTISIALCHDGKNCLFVKIMNDVFVQMGNDNAFADGAGAVNWGLRTFFKKHPRILLEKIQQIEELSSTE